MPKTIYNPITGKHYPVRRKRRSTWRIEGLWKVEAPKRAGMTMANVARAVEDYYNEAGTR